MGPASLAWSPVSCLCVDGSPLKKLASIESALLKLLMLAGVAEKPSKILRIVDRLEAAVTASCWRALLRLAISKPTSSTNHRSRFRASTRRAKTEPA